MDVDDGVREAARAVRPYLDRLVGLRAAAVLDRSLAEALTGHAEQPEHTRLLRELLDEHPLTRRFLTDVLADPPHYRPPYEQPRYHPRPGDAGPIGDHGPVTADRYICPDVSHDYVWYRPDVGTPVAFSST
jgi:hypothetical protein